MTEPLFDGDEFLARETGPVVPVLPWARIDPFTVEDQRAMLDAPALCPAAGEETQECETCGLELPLSQFPGLSYSPGYHYPYCKDCERRHQRVVRQAKRDYAVLLAAQNGVCGICKEPPEKRCLCVDHDHKTLRIRGLLCQNCNTALGKFRNDPAVLLAAIAYLRRAECLAVVSA